MNEVFALVFDQLLVSKCLRSVFLHSLIKGLFKEGFQRKFVLSNLVDWKGLELPSTERRCKLKASVKTFEHSPTVLAEWIELKEDLAKFQAERDNETSDDKGSDDMILKAERKWKSDASPVEFCRRSLAGGNVWDSVADLLKIMKLRGVCVDDVKRGPGNSVTPPYKYCQACT